MSSKPEDKRETTPDNLLFEGSGDWRQTQAESVSRPKSIDWGQALRVVAAMVIGTAILVFDITVVNLIMNLVTQVLSCLALASAFIAETASSTVEGLLAVIACSAASGVMILAIGICTAIVFMTPKLFDWLTPWKNEK